MSKDVYYFSHDSNASTDDKVLELRVEYGWEGYGIFWALIEKMFTNESTNLSHGSVKGLAFHLNVNGDLLQNIISHCVNIGLFASDGVNFWSESLLKRKQIFKDKNQTKSEAGKKGMSKRWGSDNKTPTENENVISKDNKIITEDNTVITESENVITEDNKEKEIKEKEIKENKTTTPPSVDNTKNEDSENQGGGDIESDKVVYDFFKNNINPLPAVFQLESLAKYLDDGLSPGAIVEAMKDCIGVDNPWKYLERVLQNCFQTGVRTLEQYQGRKKLHKQKGDRGKVIAVPQKSNYEQRDYSQENFDDLYANLNSKTG